MKTEQEEATRTVAIGDSVVFRDSVGTPHKSLVTNVFGPDDGNPSINVVFVSDDESQKDPYGRQIVRNTSVPHRVNQYAHGMYWDFE